MVNRQSLGACLDGRLAPPPSSADGSCALYCVGNEPGRRGVRDCGSTNVVPPSGRLLAASARTRIAALRPARVAKRFGWAMRYEVAIKDMGMAGNVPRCDEGVA